MAAPSAVLSILVTANTTQATRGLVKLNQNLGATEANANRTTAALATLGKVGAVGLGVGLGFAVKKAADFEQQMDSLGSVADASAKEMEKFRKQAMKAGADTKFSALDAAQAQTELAKGGLKVKQILKGGLNSALALAAAGELELAEAAETTANAMNLFGLEGKKSMKVADALAKAANATTADVTDFSMALKQGGAVAKSAGLSFTETVLALEALAASGVRNSDAGTSLKTALIQLIKPTEKQAALAKKLNLEFIDQAGNFKNLSAISRMLRSELGDMTKAQRTAALATIAGTDGVRTLTSLYDAGAPKLDKWRKGLQQQGTAADVAAKKQDNLKGKLENLQGSIETIAISVGTKLLPALTKAAEDITNVLNDDKLTGSEKFDKLAAMAGKAFSDAIVVLSEKAAQAAPKVASAFVNGFINTSVWGRLAIGAFLFTKMGGIGAITKAGTTAGVAAGTGFTSGLLGKAKGIAGKGGILGVIALLFGPEVIKSIDEAGTHADAAGTEFEFAAERMERLQRAGNFSGLAKAARDAAHTAKSAGDAGRPLLVLAQRMEKVGESAMEARERIARMGKDSSRSVAELQNRVSYNTRLIRESLGTNSKRGKEALTENFQAAARNVRKSMQDKTITVKRGTELIEMYMVKALQNMGFSKADALALRKRGDNSKQTPMNGELRPNQRGSYIADGKPVGDSVPSLLEKGEYVLNRNAVKKVGRKNLDAINFGMAPRFQTGGSVGVQQMVAAANRFERAGFPYLWGGGHQATPAPFGPVDCSGAVSHILQAGGIQIPTMVSGSMMNIGKPGKGAVSVYANAGHVLMSIMGRFFGTSNSNPGGGAGWIDPAPSADYLSQFVVRHFGTDDVGAGFPGMGPVPKIPNVMADGPDSLMKGVVNAALSNTRAAAQERLKQMSRAASAPIGSGDRGDAGGSWAGGNTLKWAQALASKFGLSISSTYRTPQHNAAVGGVPNSMHTHGSASNPGAVDFVPPSQAAADYARRAGVPEVLIHDAGSGLHLHTGFFQRGGLVANAARAGWKRTPINIAADALRKAGFKGRDLINMLAIAGRESGYNPRAQNLVPPDHSIGLWQINQLAHKGRYGTDAQLMDPYTNAKAARALFNASGYSPWKGNSYAGWIDGAKKAYLATKGAASGGGKAGGGKNTVTPPKGLTNKAKKKYSNKFLKVLKRFGGSSLPKSVERDINTWTRQAEVFGDFASRASALNVDNEDGSIELGVAGGKNEVGWLNDQLQALWTLRSKLVGAKILMEERRRAVAEAIERVKEQMRLIARELKGLEKFKNNLTGRLGNAKGPQKKALRQLLRATNDKIAVQSDKHAGLKKALPKLQGAYSEMGSVRSDLIGQLDTVQGAGSPMGRMATMPTELGLFGGSLFDVQTRLRDLAAPRTNVTDTTSESDSERTGILEQLLREANLRTAVSERQFDVLKNFPPYGGQFHTGGIVPGPGGQERMAVVRSGEGVFTPDQMAAMGAGGGVTINVAPGMEWLKQFISVEYERNSRRDARNAGRVLPGRGGGI